jgi:phage-related protein
MPAPRLEKPIEWIASALEDLRGLPEEVQAVMGYALHLAQRGEPHPDGKKMKGDLHDVIEIAVREDGNTYRAMYTVKYKAVVYVLHVFQKKSKKGHATPKPDLDLIRGRFKIAKKHYDLNHSSNNQPKGEHEESSLSGQLKVYK